MIFILMFFGGLAYLHYGVKNKATNQATNKQVRTVGAQPISSQAAQGFAQGSKDTPGYGKRWVEGNRAVAQKQAKRVVGTSGAGGTDRVLADLSDRMASTADPQWRMRYTHAYHRMILQSDVDNGREPSAALNIDRTSEEVNADFGPASGFTRTQFTYQDRFRRGRVRTGAGPNATRPLDQEDPGDQTTMQTTLQPNGYKSIIYPRASFDDNGTFEPWAGLREVNLERDFWGTSGRPYNQVGATQSAMPVAKGWMWGWIIPKRGKHGAYPSNRQLPGRSNRFNNSKMTGGGV